MGNWNSGRRKQPQALRMLRGTMRRTDQPEPAMPPPVDFDTVPTELTGDLDAAAEWSRVIPLLRTSGIITAAEKSLLVSLCQQWSIYVRAQHHVREHGLMLVGKRGKEVVNPRLKIGDHALQHCRQLWIELGLTPSSRAKLAAKPVGHVEKPARWATDLA